MILQNAMFSIVILLYFNPLPPPKKRRRKKYQDTKTLKLAWESLLLNFFEEFCLKCLFQKHQTDLIKQLEEIV